MHSHTLIALALAAGAVSASPVYRRQVVSVTETNTVDVPETMATTPGLTPSAAVPTGSNDDDTDSVDYSNYPCPEGYLLTYAQGNRTLGQPIDVTNAAVGEWADAIIFPNLTASEGGSTIGATHTFNLAGVAFPEVLINSTNEGGSAYVQYVYNNTAPVTVGDVTLSNYSAVYKSYDPTFPITGTRGPSTLVQIFINACASDQDAARPLLQNLIDVQLGLITNDTAGNGGVLVTSVLSTDSLTATETNTAIATETNTDIASTTVLDTATAQVTQTNTVIPAVTSVVAATNQVTTTAATEQVTVTPATETATTTAVTNTNTVATVSVTANVVTVATTTTSV